MTLEVRAPLTEAMTRKQSDREMWVPVRLGVDGATPLTYHGSAHIHAFIRANGLVAMAAGELNLPAGAEVTVRLLRGEV